MKIKIQINPYQLSRVTGKILKHMRTKQNFGPLIDRNTMLFIKKKEALPLFLSLFEKKPDVDSILIEGVS